MSQPQTRADTFPDPDRDPRAGGPSLGDERTTLTEFLRTQRLTLELKCQGLDPEQLARRAVTPSTLSLLGLLRHMAEVESTAKDKHSRSSKPVRSFKKSTKIYTAVMKHHSRLDGDKDGIACEKH